MFDGVEFRAVRGLKDQADVFGYLQLARAMPAGLIHLHEDEGVCKLLRNLVQKEVHHVGIG